MFYQTHALERFHYQYEEIIFAPKVHFLNTDLSEECPVCVSRQNWIDAAALSGLDGACAGAERTPESVQRCASPSVASLARWR